MCKLSSTASDNIPYQLNAKNKILSPFSAYGLKHLDVYCIRKIKNKGRRNAAQQKWEFVLTAQHTTYTAAIC